MWRKTNTYFIFNNSFFLSFFFFFRKLCRVRDNVGKYCTEGQATGDSFIRRMRIPCRIPQSKNTPTEYVIFIFSPLQQWLHEHASALRHTYIASLVQFENTLVRCTYWSVITKHIFHGYTVHQTMLKTFSLPTDAHNVKKHRVIKTF